MKTYGILAPIPFLLALVLAAPASAAQTESSADKVPPGDASVARTAGSQRSARVVPGGAGALVVWADERSRVGAVLTQTSTDVYALRLDAAGQPIDGEPIVVAGGFGAQTSPKAVWNGTSWLVAWVSQVPNQFFYEWTVEAVRVAPDGSVLDAVPIRVPVADSSSVGFDLTLVGTNWVVVFQGTSSGNGGIHAVRVAGDGTLVDATPVQLVPPTFFLYFGVEAAGTSNRLLVTYEGQSQDHGRVFDASLTQVGGVLNLPGTRVASNGTEFYVTWTSGANLLGSPLDTNGVLTVPGGAVLAPAASVVAAPFGGSIAWDGGLWWIGWEHAVDGIQLRRVRPNGAPLGSVLALDPQNAAHHALPTLATLPSGDVQVVWADVVQNDSDVFGSRVDQGLQVGPQTVLSSGPPAQTRTELARGPNGTFVLTCLSRSADAMAALAFELDRFGNVLAGPHVLGTGTNLGAPAAAWNGQEWLFVWTDAGRIVGRRADPNLGFLEAVPFPVMDGFSADVEALGDDFLVVGTEYGSSVHFLFPRATRVDGPTGSVLDSPPLVLGNSFAQLPRVAEVGNRWLVVWQRNFSHDDPQAAIEAAFVDTDGTSPGSFVVQSASGGQPDVASRGNEALVVWRQYALASANNAVWARVVDVNGTFPAGPSLIVSDAVGRQLDPAVAWNGSHYLVVWEDTRGQLAFFDDRTELYGARLDALGTVLDPSGFPVGTSTGPAIDPAAAASSGDVIAARARFEPGVGWRAAVTRIGHWTDEGAALAGSTGAPVLEALGERAADSTVHFQVSGAPVSSIGWYVLGTTRIDLPVASGVLVPSLDFLVGFGTDADGVHQASYTFPPPVPPGTSLYLQAWVLDLLAPELLAASNALSHTAP